MEYADTSSPPNPNQMLRSLLDDAQTGIFQSLLNGTIVYANHALAHMIGYSHADEMVHTNATLLYKRPHDRQRLLELVYRDGKVINYEVELTTRTGNDIMVLITMAQKNNLLSGTIIDITERKRAEAQINAYAQRLEVLARVSRIFAEAGTDYQAVLQLVACTITDLLSDTCTIRLLSDDGQWLNLVTIYDPDPEALALQRTIIDQAPLNINNPHPAQQILVSGQPLFLPVIDRTQLRPTLPSEARQALDRIGSHSMLVVPLTAYGQRIGTLGIYRRQAKWPAFTEEDLRLTQDLADRAVLAISNARLYQDLQVELARRVQAEADLRVSEERSRLAIDAAELGTWRLDLVANTAMYDARSRAHLGIEGEVASLAAASRYIHPDDRERITCSRRQALDPATSKGLYHAEYRVIHPNGELHWLSIRARIYFAGEDAARHPVLVIGTCQDITERKQSEAQIRELNTELEARVVARTAEVRSALDRVQALYDITNAAIATDNLTAALQYAVDHVATTLNVDRVLLLIFDWNEQSVKHMIYGGRGVERIYATPTYDAFIDGLPGWAIRERRPAISPNGGRDPRENPEAQCLRAALNCGAIAAVPLAYLDEVFGSLMVINQPTEPNFTDEDVKLMVAVAGQIAIAYARARLTERIQQTNRTLQAEINERAQLEQQIRQHAERATALAELSRDLAEAGMAEQPLFDMIAHKATVLLGDAAIITLLSDDAEWRETIAIDHRDPVGRALLQAVRPTKPISSRQGWVGQVIQTGQPYFAPTLSAEQARTQGLPDQQIYFDRFAAISVIIVPMHAHGRMLGTLSLLRYQPSTPHTRVDLAFLQDIADRAGLAIENARLYAVAMLARAEAEHAARLKDEFLASMSHELRTPLNAILGRSEVLLEGIYGPLTPKQVSSLRNIDESGRHLLALINDILDLSKIEAGKFQLEYSPVDIATLCRASLQMVTQTAFKKQIKLSFTTDNLVETLNGDERRLKQILVNLLSNAVKFTPEGGKIGLELCGDRDQQTITFTVWDTGIGIAEADLPRLFKPFMQIDSSLSRKYTGTGLGLSLVLRLVQAHQGSVTVQTARNQGSRFCVVLPWLPRPTAAPLAPQAQPTNHVAPPIPPTIAPVAQVERTTTDSQQRQILLVEDNQTNIDVVQDYLIVKGYTVAVAYDGSDALRHVQANPPHAIIMDIQMPGMDGLEAIRRIRTELNLRKVPIIALTALAMPGDRERCITAGANAYLTKPINLRLLVTTLGTLLEAPPAYG